MPQNEVTYYLTKRQTLAFNLLTNSEDASVMYGGAKGGGKSVLFCLWVFHWVDWLIQFFGLEQTPHPVPLGFIGRKQAVDFNHTTLETFKKVIPPNLYHIKTQEKEIVVKGAAKILYGGLDDQERIKKFNSAEYAFIGLDQAEETQRTDVDLLQGTLRLTINGKQPPYKQLYTANPADCWLKEDFIDNRLDRHHYVPALPTDNKYLPEGYVELLRQIWKYNPALLKAYLEGDWYALQAENSLISSAMLNELKGVTRWPQNIRRIVGCDPSLGGDECVIYFIENGHIKETLILHERDTMKIAGHITVLGEKNHCPNYAVDSIGIGQGIADRIRELNPKNNVQAINSAEKADDEEHFANVKAEMSWYVMTQVQDKNIPYPEDEELRNQLTSLRFKVINSNGKIQMLPKEEIKKRIGRSPDRADAFLISIYALAKTEPIKNKDKWRDSESHEVGSAATSAMTA